MKKIGYALFITALLSFAGSCTSEGDDDLDVLTPNDSTETSRPDPAEIHGKEKP